MLRFSANIGGGRIKRLFSEYPFLERFDRAAAAGFEAVEFPEPYGEGVRAIRAALTRNGLRQMQFNLPWGDHAAGEVGIANNPGRRVEFRDGVSRALGVADLLGCPRLLCHVGITLPDVPLEAQRASVAETLATPLSSPHAPGCASWSSHSTPSTYRAFCYRPWRRP